MKKQFLLILWMFTTLCLEAKTGFDLSGKEDSVKNYLRTALNLMKKRSVNTHKVNWDQIYAEAYRAANGAKTIRDVYPVIVQALNKLEDSHSKFFPPEAVKNYTMGYKATGQPFPEIKAGLLKAGYAFISMPSFYSYNFAEWNAFADTFREQVKKLEKQKPFGWIIDLRDNDGGMLAPMYAALAPFVDREQAIGWKDGAGKNHFITYRNNRLQEDKVITHLFMLTNGELKIRKKPVVVLMNRKTASSGEFAAALFAGQKNVTFIGTASNGLTSSNQEHKLADGAFLVLTEGKLIDRNQHEYATMGEGLQPDVSLENLIDDAKHNDKLYMEKAIEILNQKRSPLKPKVKGL